MTKRMTMADLSWEQQRILETILAIKQHRGESVSIEALVINYQQQLLQLDAYPTTNDTQLLTGFN